MASIDKLEELIQREIALIIQNELKNPKIGFITITDVELNRDKSLAKVFVSFLGSENRNVAGLKALEQSKGFLRTELSKKLDIRKVPELEFRIDESIEEGNKIEKIIKVINTK